MRRGRGLPWGMCALAGALLGCETTRNPGGVQRDVVPPTIQLKTASDTQDIAGGLNFSVVATDNLGLKDIRLTYTGGFISQTDTVFTSAVTTLTLQEKITPGSGAGGLIRIVGRATDGSANFAVDSGNRVAQTSPITVTIQSVATDNTAPQIEQTIAQRAEANDSITVHATDPSGITDIGFRVYNLAGTLISQGSIVLGGTSTDAVKKFPLGLTTLTPIPQQVVVQAFACDGATAHNCGVAGQVFTVPSPTGAARADTVTIVAGATIALPFGGKIVDAIYNANRRELYLTNPGLGRVEIFQAANSTFVAAGIPTAGAQPWGVALWPRDTLGAYGDTIVVANSGGTQLAIIDVSPGARVLRWRQDLPDYLIQTYRVTCAPGCKTIITEYNVSDRPQYVATVCRPGRNGPTLCDQDSIFAIYSTTPEPSNPAPFTGRATLRMEKLINPGNPPNPAVLFGHLFWAIAGSAP